MPHFGLIQNERQSVGCLFLQIDLYSHVSRQQARHPFCLIKKEAKNQGCVAFLIHSAALPTSAAGSPPVLSGLRKALPLISIVNRRGHLLWAFSIHHLCTYCYQELIPPPITRHTSNP
jgi:hypothetical protein